MRPLNVLLPLAVLLASAASIRAADELPASAIGGEEPLAGAAKIRYLLRQIDFLPAQLATIDKMAGEELPARLAAEAGLDEVKRIYQEIEGELAQGAQRDQARIDELTRRLRWLGEDRSRDRTFLAEIEPMLSDGQRAALVAARERLARHASGGLRPIDLVHAARASGLSNDQEHRLQRVLLDTRERVGTGLKQTLAQRVDAINFCLAAVRELLTPTQRPTFDRAVTRLRPDLIAEGLIAAPVDGAPLE